MYGTTIAPLDKKDPVRTRITKMLCKVSDPEEKRRIIGDVFMEVELVCTSTKINAICAFKYRTSLRRLLTNTLKA